MIHFILIFYAQILHLIRRILMSSMPTMKLIYMPGINKLRWFNGYAKAYQQFYAAKKNVPAYKLFLNEKKFTGPSVHKFIPSISEIPFTDKENYVKQYSIEQRCVNGRMPDNEVVIDESSGSSGVPTNWVRGKRERETNGRIIQLGIRTLYPDEPLFVINAFALGPWATGVNVTMSCVKFSKLKSLGPDKSKILNTLTYFGTSHHYLVMGYPPFLKSLVETSDIDWAQYNVTLIFGGEAMTESMRDYLFSKGIKSVYSSYGASDIELNMAFESDFSISLRRLLRDHEGLRKKVLKYEGPLPMIFQFNPSDFLIENNKEGELIITICRDGYIAPKIRYNIHDKGHIVNYKDLLHLLDEAGISRDKLMKPKTDLPILFHYGRTDNTVSYFGANISPTDIQEVIFQFPSLASSIHSFYININEDETGGKQLEILLELNEPYSSEEMPSIQEEFFQKLTLINQDFREAIKMVPEKYKPMLTWVPYKTGIFKDADIRIKLRYS